MKSQLIQRFPFGEIKIDAKLEREVEKAVDSLPYGKFNEKAKQVEAQIRAKRQKD